MVSCLGPALEPFFADAGDEALMKRRGNEEDRQACEQGPLALCLYDEAEAVRVKSPPPRARREAQESTVASLLLCALTDAGAEPEGQVGRPQATDSLLFRGLYVDGGPRRSKGRRRSRGADRAGKGNPHRRDEAPTTAPASLDEGCDVAPVMHGPASKPRQAASAARPLC
ncbi:unnamed protein product [Prorocentrum cordatum]|uniref:Uncharacterized protein n=1 Tax=Prorocentrum cordatum TaxID=2364126 RepID=A0ABN9TL54_9DINO|nr:unnamed protein product [Polarella glacialis]